VVQQASTLFYLDYGLFLLSGIGVCLFNTFYFGFPLSSGLKIVAGFAALGLIPAFDLSLEWECTLLRRVSTAEKDGGLHRAYSPQTRKIAVLAASTVIFLTFSLLLILSNDIVRFMGRGAGNGLMPGLLRSVIWEVVFVMTTFLVFTLLAVFSYARNLKLLFANQTSVLQLVGQDRLETKVPVVTRDEFAMIAEHTNIMIDRLRERERMSKGLGLASQIQAKLLPKASPLLPGVQVHGASFYCDETGGDFYDFFVREGSDGSELVALVGDGTGHGVGSALLMTSARAYLKAHLLHLDNLEEVMNATNAVICRDVAGSGNFITVFLFAYNPVTRRGRWVSGGHNPGIFCAFRQSEQLELSGRDIPLGVDAGWRYSVETHVFPPGLLLLGTDGIWEAMDKNKVMFGKDRLYKVMAEHLHAGPQQITTEIFKKIDEFTGAAPVDDDRTAVIARLL